MIRAALIMMLVPIALSACGQKDGVKTTEGVAAPVSNGTGSLGGGGNGIDEKMLESFAINIDTLPEYRRYIEPIIRKIGRGRGDILTTYMKWGVKQKVWYMIPRPLTDLSRDQIGTGFSTDQYALNNDARVYIAKATFLKMDHKERAKLLLHEIVMSARLLMKKKPTEQCEKLAGAQLPACSDPEMMKLAEAQDISEDDRGRMDQPDHDAVRNMTIYLLQSSSDLSPAAIMTKRRQLGFIFPWDKALSTLSLTDVATSIARGNLAESVLQANADIRPFKQPTPSVCHFYADNRDEDSMTLTMDVSLAEPAPMQTGAQPGVFPTEWRPYSLRSSPTDSSRTDVVLENGSMWIESTSIEAHGVLEPVHQKSVVDLVTLRPKLVGQNIADALKNPQQYDLKQIRLWITREENPRIIRASVNSLKILLKGHPDIRDITPDDWDFVMVEKERFNCQRL